jgi:hypothetical protein
LFTGTSNPDFEDGWIVQTRGGTDFWACGKEAALSAEEFKKASYPTLIVTL